MDPWLIKNFCIYGAYDVYQEFNALARIKRKLKCTSLFQLSLAALQPTSKHSSYGKGLSCVMVPGAGWAVLTRPCSGSCIWLRLPGAWAQLGPWRLLDLPQFAVFHLRLLPGVDSRLQEGKTQAARTLKASTPERVAPATLFGQSTSQSQPRPKGWGRSSRLEIREFAKNLWPYLIYCFNGISITAVCMTKVIIFIGVFCPVLQYPVVPGP